MTGLVRSDSHAPKPARARQSRILSASADDWCPADFALSIFGSTLVGAGAVAVATTAGADAVLAEDAEDFSPPNGEYDRPSGVTISTFGSTLTSVNAGEAVATTAGAEAGAAVDVEDVSPPNGEYVRPSGVTILTSGAVLTPVNGGTAAATIAGAEAGAAEGDEDFQSPPNGA